MTDNLDSIEIDPAENGICGLTYDHDLVTIDERGGMVSLECRECGTEIFYEGDNW